MALEDERDTKETMASWVLQGEVESKDYGTGRIKRRNWTKRQKGDTGTAGMKGAKRKQGESIAAPTIAVSPAKMTVNESKTASFQCSVSGNPKPVST